MGIGETPCLPADSDWPEVRVQVPAQDAGAPDERIVEQLEDWLVAAGALSVTLIDTDNAPAASAEAVLEPAPGEVRLWRRVTLVGLFAQGTRPQALTTALVDSLADAGLDTLPEHELTGLADAVWEREWLRDFGPMDFGPRFQVVPTEHDVTANTDTVSLRLDPGLAFGTGTHPTTALCLAWMGKGTAESLTPLQGLDVIDYGTGSGILAIAALLLGAAHVDAVDIDAQALIATRDNAQLNGVAERMRVGKPDLLDDRLTSSALRRCDLLLANILHGPLLELGERFADLLTPGGHVVLSGLLETQSASLRVRYTPWFEFEPDVTCDGWVVMTAVRRA